MKNAPRRLWRLPGFGHLSGMSERKRLTPSYLKAWRTHRGLTQEQLADRIGCSQTFLSRVERGQREYTQELLEAAADALRVEPWQIIRDDPTKDEADIVDLWSRVPDDKRDTIRQMIDAVTRKTGS